MPNLKGINIHKLGLGIDTITEQHRNSAIRLNQTDARGKTQTPLDLRSTKVESLFSIATSKFYHSTADLLLNFNSSLATSIPNTTINFNLDLTHLSHGSKESVFYVLEAYCIENTEFLQKTQLTDQIKKLLQEPKELPHFFSSYGDAYVNSITHGKHALLIIRFNNIAQEDSTKLEVEIKSSQALSGGIQAALEKKFSYVTCEAYCYTAGIALHSLSLRSATEIDSFLAKFSFDTVQSAQIRWSFDPYLSLLDATDDSLYANAKIQLEELTRLSATARYLKKTITKLLSITHLVLSSIRPPELDSHLLFEPELDRPQISIQTQDRAPSQLLSIITKVEEIDEAFKAIETQVNNNVCEKLVIEECWIKTDNQKMKLQDLLSDLPHFIDVPIKIIPGDLIQNIKHSKQKGSFTFSLPCPSGTIGLRVRTSEPRVPRIELKEFRALDSKHIKKIRCCSSIQDCGLLPPPLDSSQFYLKHHERQPITEGLYVLFYAKIQLVNIPRDILPSLSRRSSPPIHEKSLPSEDSVSQPALRAARKSCSFFFQDTTTAGMKVPEKRMARTGL